MREAQELFKMKEQLEEAKSDTDKAEGRLSAAMDTLRKDFAHTTLKQADKELSSIGSNIIKLQEEVREGVVELKDVHEWNRT